MSDEHEWVRRLLAEAQQAGETMPAEVADRLDRVLDDLSGEHGAATPTSPVETGPVTTGVVPMTPRRHRRWAGALLAAAAVTVGGYAVTSSGVLGGMSGSESQSAADSAAGGSLGEEGPAGAAAEGAGGRPGSGGADALVQRDLGGSGAAALSSTSLRRDAARLVAVDARHRSLRAGQESAVEDSRAAPAQTRGAITCLPPPPSVPGREIAVTYDGTAATAVVRRTGADRTEIQLWACDSPVRLARVVVPR